MSFNDFAIVTVGKNHYRIHFLDMTKLEGANMMKSTDLIEKSGQL